MKKQSKIADIIITILLGYLTTMIIVDFARICPSIHAPLNWNFAILSSMTEEILKYITCLYILYKISRKYVYILLPLVGISFGLTEQTIRLIYRGYFPWQPLAIHTAMALTMSLFLYKASKKHKFVYYTLALVVPMFIHIMYNIIIITIYS